MRSSTTIAFVVLLTSVLICSNAERVYEEIEWSSELCAQMGHASDFEVCALLEFCEGHEEDYGYRHTRRYLRDRHHKIATDSGGDGHPHTSVMFQHNKQGAQGKEGEQWGTAQTFADQVPEAEEEEEELKEQDEDGKVLDDSPETSDESQSVLASQSDESESDSSESDASSSDETQSKESESDTSQSEETDSVTTSDVSQSDTISQSNESSLSDETQSDESPSDDPADPIEPMLDGDEEESLGYIDEYPQSSVDKPGPNNARYGWRIPGSSHCSWPGPLIRLKRGQKHGLFVKGSGKDTPTNLHLHGLHIPGSGNSDDPSRTIKGDDMIIYNIDVPEDTHMGGTHWYHTHYHGMSFEQIGGGAFGLLIVDDNGHDVGTSDGNVLSFLEKDRLLVLDDRIGKWVANGLEHGDTYSFNKDEWYRLRILAVSLDAHHSTEVIEFGKQCGVRAIAHDGIFRFQVPAEAKLFHRLTVASRLDLAIRCSSSSSIKLNGNQVASISVAENPDADLESTPFESGDQTWLSKRPPYLEDLRMSNVDNHWTVKIDTTNINGISCMDHRPLCSDQGTDFQYGSVQEWTLRSVNSHSFHAHMYPMQIVSDSGCGSGHDVGEFYDTVFAVKTSTSDQCKVRLNFVDVAGPVMMHCHNLMHSDHGSMGYIMVQGGPIQANEPRVQECTSGPVCDEPHIRNVCGM